MLQEIPPLIRRTHTVKRMKRKKKKRLGQDKGPKTVEY